MGLSYAWQKFHGAKNLLTSELPLREGLKHAIASNLIHIKPEDLPEEIRSDFNALMDSATRIEAIHEEGTIAATINSLTADELETLKDKIVFMHDKVSRLYGKS